MGVTPEIGLLAILLEHNRPFAVFEIAELYMVKFGHDDPAIIIDMFDQKIGPAGIVAFTIPLRSFGTDLLDDGTSVNLDAEWERTQQGSTIAIGYDFAVAVSGKEQAILAAAKEAGFNMVPDRLKLLSKL